MGELGERFAARSLRRSGWRVLGRRVRTPWAEVDLVLERGGVLVCCEVKTSRGAPDDVGGRAGPGRRFDARAQARQQRAARWLARRRRPPLESRVDLLEVWIDHRGRARERLSTDHSVKIFPRRRFL